MTSPDRVPENNDNLSENEAKRRAPFEAIDDGFCIIEFIDGPNGPLSDYVHVEANSGSERQTGISDIVGKSCARSSLPMPMSGLNLRRRSAVG